MQSLTAKDLMVPKDEYARITADATLSQAALALDEAQKSEQRADPTRHRDRAILVVDKNGKILGKLTMLDVLQGLVPRHDRVVGAAASSRAAARVGSARLIIESMNRETGLWNKPLSNLVEKASSVKVRRLLRPVDVGETIDEEAPFDAALHQLIMGRFQSLLVTRNGEIVGILRLIDVYDRISRLLIPSNSDSIDAG